MPANGRWNLIRRLKVNLCVLEQTLQKPNASSYLENSQTKICCVLVKSELSDGKFSFQINCKYVVRPSVVSVNLRCPIFVCATPAPVQITKWLQISGLLGRIAFFKLIARVEFSLLRSSFHVFKFLAT